MVGTVDFDKLIGLKASLYYRSHMNQFQLGDVIFEVAEDENDGYRSSMKEVVILDQDAARKPGDLLGEVIIESGTLSGGSDFEGYQLRDTKDNHIWYLFGTSNTDDYYPCFTFCYTAKKPIASA